MKETPGPRRGRISDEDRELAKTKIAEAFALAGFVEGSDFVCPTCRKVHKSRGTMKVRPTGWYCYSAGEGGDSISLLQEHLGMSFPEAVNTLLGRQANTDGGEPRKPKRKIRLPSLEPARATSIVDPEVYLAALTFSGEEGRKAAAEYYGQWHIAPGPVRESGAVLVPNMPALHAAMVERFGMDRLKKCGLVTTTRKGRDFWLLNDEYPVIEPHWTPSGKLVGMQFRPSYAQLEKVKAHARWAAAKASGDTTSVPEAKYVPKFLSLAGVNPEESLIGCGLYRLARLPEGSTVVIVEGFKDLLAARTMGQEAYGIPGTASALPDRVLALLRRHNVLVALDGDEAGRAAVEKLLERLHEAGIRAQAALMPDGMDVADILARKAATRAA